MPESTEPAKQPRWATAPAPPTAVTEPSEGKKDVGWGAPQGEKPAPDTFNWLFYTIYTWTVWLRTKMSLFIGFGADTELTIAAGSVTPTQANHTVDTQSDAASDDLDTIVTTNLDAGRLLILRAENIARVVTIKHNTGNVKLSGGEDMILNSAVDQLVLKRVGSDWLEVSRSKALGGGRQVAVIYAATGTYTSGPGVYIIKARIKGASGGSGSGGGTDAPGNNGTAGGDSWVLSSTYKAVGGGPGLGGARGLTPGVPGAGGTGGAAVAPTFTQTGNFVGMRYGAAAGANGAAGDTSTGTGGAGGAGGASKPLAIPGAAGGPGAAGNGGAGNPGADGEATAPGGGGSGGNGVDRAGGGGGGGAPGEYAEWWIEVTPGVPITVTVGTKGIAGTQPGGVEHGGAGADGGDGLVIIEA